MTGLALVTITIIFGCFLVWYHRRIELLERKVGDLESGRPVKIDDPVVRLTKNRQDR